MKSTGRKTVKVERTSAPLKKTARAAKQAAPVEKMDKVTQGKEAEGKEVEGKEAEGKEARTATAALAMAPTLRVPTYEEIAVRSFELFLARGGDQGFGSAEQDWLQAERELSRP